MHVLLVAFEFNSKTQDYYPFLSYLNQRDTIQLTNRSFALHTLLPPEQIYEQLSPLLGPNDPLYVMPLLGPFRSRALKKKNDWLTERLKTNIYKMKLEYQTD